MAFRHPEHFIVLIKVCTELMKNEWAEIINLQTRSISKILTNCVKTCSVGKPEDSRTDVLFQGGGRNV